MLDLQKRPLQVEENHHQLRELLGTYGPASLQDVRDAALLRFLSAGVPTQKDEEFKYVSLRVLEEGRFGPAYGATIDRHEANETPLGKLDAITLSFINGQYAPELSSADSLPDNVFVGELRDGLMIHEETVLRHLGKIASLEGKLGTTNDERFVDLNTAFLSEGALVLVPRGVALERPIHLQFLNRADHGPYAVHPRVMIIAEDAAQVKVVESYVGLKGLYFSNSVTEVFAGKDSIIEHTKFQLETPDSVHLATIAIHQETGSTYTSTNINLGAKIARNDVNVWGAGEHTETWLNGAAVGMGEQVIDNHTRIDHAQPNCHSFEVYKSVLGDKASGVFNGKIFVYKDAQKTDAKQTNQALLLSPQAGMNTKPQLEIFADDVKCTHGATVGQLREDAMFYLRARGIPKKEAEALLVYAFAAEALDRVTIDEVRHTVENLIFAKLHGERTESPAVAPED